ncbi:MAG: pyridoxal-dependent decarboxylase, exosortase A system-associated [bacterium]
MSEKPRHPPVTQFPVRDDHLMIAGRTVHELADEIGSTPFFVYDGPAIAKRVNQLRSILPEAISIHYAVKANPYPALVKDLCNRVDGLDVASAGELRLALNTSIDPTAISFAGPGKQDHELELAIQNRVLLNVESQGELQRIANIGEQLGIRPRVSSRINPDFELKSAGMKMGGRSTPFGLDSEQVPDFLAAVKDMDVEFSGLHVFNGSQNLHPDQIAAAQRATFELAVKLAPAFPAPMKTFNIGGGLGIPYFPGDKPLDLQPIADNLSQLLIEYSDLVDGVEVILELGRYLVGEAGIYVCKIIDKKVSRGKTWLIVNGGMHHHLAASGNLGQLIRKNYPVVNPDRIDRGPREHVYIAGPLCTPLDILASNLDIGTANPGDYIAVLQSGAYAQTASPQAFLSHEPAIEVYLPTDSAEATT